MCSGLWGGSSGASAATADATTTRGDLIAEGGRGGLPRDGAPAASAGHDIQVTIVLLEGRTQLPMWRQTAVVESCGQPDKKRRADWAR